MPVIVGRRVNESVVEVPPGSRGTPDRVRCILVSDIDHPQAPVATDPPQRTTARAGAPRRRLPRWSEVQPYLRTGPLRLNPTERRLASAATIWDLRSVARRHTPARRVRLRRRSRRDRDRACVDLARPSTGSSSCRASCRTSRRWTRRRPSSGGPPALPLVFAPTGFTRLMNHEGEPAVARVAGRLGIPYALSTLGTTSPEDVAAAAPDTDKWFQLYLWNDRDAGIELVRRARAAGFTRARPDRRHAGRRSPAPRRPQRLHDPADAVGPDRSPTSPSTPAGGSTC